MAYDNASIVNHCKFLYVVDSYVNVHIQGFLMAELIIRYPEEPPMTIKDIKPNALTLEEIERLPTPRILAYRKKYRWLSSIGRCGCCGEILYKSDVERNRVAVEYMDAIKAILDTREHVDKA